MDDAFRHHVWATLRLTDACASLTLEQLQTVEPGTYGSILDTMRHLVGSDAGYLHAITDGRTRRIDDDAMGLPELRAAMERNGHEWATVLAGDLDPDRAIIRRRDDGSETHAPLGIRLAQAIHHGTDHRSQVCTALTSLGIEPPLIDAWDFGEAMGTVVEIPPAT